MKGIPTLAKKIFKTHFLASNCIEVLPRKWNEMFRPTYVAGVIYKLEEYGSNLYHYDINSLYPYCMLKPLPTKFIDYYDSNDIVLDNFFGYLHVIVERPEELKIGLLPRKVSIDEVTLGRGKWEYIYFSEEVKLAKK
jgi:hypothetical protein